MLTTYVCESDRLAEIDAAAASASAVWFDLLNPEAAEVTGVEAALAIDIPTRDEMEEIELSARLYQEGGAAFMTMTALAGLDSEEPTRTPVTFILKGSSVVTVRFAEPKPFHAYTTRACKANAGQCASGEQVMLGLLEAMTDRIADALEKAAGDVDKLSREVFSGRKRNVGKMTRDLQGVIEQIGRRAELLMMIQESLVSIGRLMAYHTAIEPGGKAPGSRAAKQLAKLIQRDATSLGEYAESLNTRLTFLLDATLGLINLEQNGIIKIFSVAAVVFLPPTLVASIYGMNYTHMPELDWTYGYPFALGLMVLSAILPYLFFKRKGWL